MPRTYRHNGKLGDFTAMGFASDHGCDSQRDDRWTIEQVAARYGRKPWTVRAVLRQMEVTVDRVGRFRMHWKRLAELRRMLSDSID